MTDEIRIVTNNQPRDVIEPYELITPEIVFNMDLANAPTSLRFCYVAVDVLDTSPQSAAQTELDGIDEDDEFLSDIVDEWNDRLETAGYYADWDCGDVVVYDLRPLSDEERDSFFDSFA